MVHIAPRTHSQPNTTVSPCQEKEKKEREEGREGGERGMWGRSKVIFRSQQTKVGEHAMPQMWGLEKGIFSVYVFLLAGDLISSQHSVRIKYFDGTYCKL